MHTQIISYIIITPFTKISEPYLACLEDFPTNVIYRHPDWRHTTQSRRVRIYTKTDPLLCGYWHLEW